MRSQESEAGGKIVSVLPTLEPGQSAQVTLRFDPSESGNFTGTVQVGITDGQGSVSSSPLVGVAHKIEVSPAELNFGLVFVGSTKAQKLTVKNQGVTNVPLMVSTAAPFSIVSEGSFTLAPSETHEVVVQLSPTVSGSFTGSVQFTSGLLATEASITAAAYTFEDYLEYLTSLYNQVAELAISQGKVPGLYIPYHTIIVGMVHLTGEQLREILQLQQELQNGSGSMDQGIEFVNTTEIRDALAQLRPYIGTPNFVENLERVKVLYPLFAQFLEIVASLISESESSVALRLVQMEGGDDFWNRYERVVRTLLNLGIFKGVPLGGTIGLPQPGTPEYRYASFMAFVHTSIFRPEDLGLEAGAARQIVDKFLRAIENFLNGVGIATGTIEQLVTSLLNTIPGPSFTLWPIGVRTPSLQIVREFLRLAQLVGNMATNRSNVIWKFYPNFHQSISCGIFCTERIDLIATARIASIGDVTVFARAFDFVNQPVDIDKVVQALEAILDHIANNGHSFGPLGDLDVAVAFIGSQTTDAQAQKIMDRIANRHPGIPVVLVYCVAGCNGPNPTYKLKYRGLTKAQAEQIACAMGFEEFCGGYTKPGPSSGWVIAPPPLSCCYQLTPEGTRLQVEQQRRKP